VGGFAADAGEVGQLIHRRGDFAAMQLDECCAHAAEAFGSVAEKAGGLDVFFELALGGIRKRFGGGIFPEQVFGDDVDAVIGALGGENRRDEKLKRRGII